MSKSKSLFFYGLPLLVISILLIFLSTPYYPLNIVKSIDIGDVTFPGSSYNNYSSSLSLDVTPSFLAMASVKNVEKHGEVLIKTGELNFSVENYQKTYKSIIQNIQKLDGYIVSESSYGSHNISLKIRVPAQNFHQLFEFLLKEANKDRSIRKSINVKDVTEEYMDVESRIRSKKLIEERYLEILSKATEVSELLDVEKYLGDIRTEIEQVEGRLKYLKNKSDFSTIDLRISKVQKTKELKEDSLTTKIQDSFDTGWNRAISLMLFIASNWFIFILIFGVIFFMRRKYINKK